MATIKDVAKRAGVSLSTVSRVLNGHPYVADELRSRVLDAIEALNYRPNRVAQRLRAARSHLVGVIFSDVKNPFYTLVLSGIEHILSEQGLSVLISNSNTNQDREDNFTALMLAEEVAGLIVAPVQEDSPVLAEVVQNGLPVAVIDRRMCGLSVDTVLADNQSGACMAIRHLIQLGHRRIAILNGPQRLTSGRERYAGFLQAMGEAGLDIDPGLVWYGDYQMESGYTLTRELLRLPQPPTALFVANNLMTIGVLNAIHEAGCNIPEDLAVIGFDDVPWAVSLNPPLTTVAQPSFEIGVRAARLLLDRIAAPDRPACTTVLQTRLMVRASCGAAGRRHKTQQSERR
ncbi:MAG: LacI family DNA-binding transcriptional regulator [Anaerolineae bacterium]|nr:LacI family DNA-binding transcriptional regulator [Anaerolineae bacterium]